MFVDALVQTFHTGNNGLGQSDRFFLFHQRQAAADFCHAFAQGIHAPGFGTLQPFDELPFYGGDIARHFSLDARQ